jgi:hypothetical protein
LLLCSPRTAGHLRVRVLEPAEALPDKDDMRSIVLTCVLVVLGGLLMLLYATLWLAAKTALVPPSAWREPEV